jgi:hypothetical protein
VPVDDEKKVVVEGGVAVSGQLSPPPPLFVHKLMSVWHATDAPNILHTSPPGTVSPVREDPMEID